LSVWELHVERVPGNNSDEETHAHGLPVVIAGMRRPRRIMDMSFTVHVSLQSLVVGL
jgi:hypothetical protein